MMNLNATMIGLVFLVNAVAYALVTPLSGWIGDKTVSFYNTPYLDAIVMLLRDA